MAQYDIVLFDLDGTISESAPGIKRCIELTLDEMGYEYPDLSDYSKYIGPPLTNTFHLLCGLNMDKAYEAIEVYRKYYNKFGIENNVLYDGIDDVIKTLKKDKVKIAVCSSKTESLANEVLKFLKIKDLFDAVCGSLQNGTRKEKEELIPYAIESLNETFEKRIVLIGDSKFDAKGAMNTNIDFIGVSYGYGTVEQMEEAGATIFVDRPSELLSYF